MEDLKVDIEIGESTAAKKHGLQRWWWRMEGKGFYVNSEKMDFKSKGSAMRSARTYAKRLHLDVESVREYGEEGPSE